MSVALVLINDEQKSELLRWGKYFAQGLGNALHVYVVGERSRDTEILEQPTPDEITAGDTEVTVEEVRAAAPGAEILRQLRTRKCQLLVVPNRGDETIRSFLFRHSNCDVLLLDPHTFDGEPLDQNQRILVPASGGDNARGALRMARQIAKAHVSEVDALFVQPTIGQDADRVGRRIVDKLISTAIAGKPTHVHGRVVVANHALSAITDISRSGYDLVLLGASNLNPVRRMFGTIPDQILATKDCPTVGVFRRAIPLTTRAEEFIIRSLRRTVPQLDRDARIELVEKVQSNSQFNFDFVTLVCLSTLIAGLGLIRNSAAVVIGAMLVAPLMTPLLGCGLALVHGNLVLVRNALRAVLLGFVLSFVIGCLLGWFVPGVDLNAELSARGDPNVLDLLVAFASGVAAAYATARPGLSGALPGVAIAAALVPPIATSGMAAALGEGFLLLGSLTLFFTNIVAIVLGSALSLYALGLRGDHSVARRQLWIRHATITLIFVVGALTIPLSYMLYRKLPSAHIPSAAHDEVKTFVNSRPHARFRSIGNEGTKDGQALIRVTIVSPGPPDRALADSLREILRRHEGLEQAGVRVVTELAVESP